MLYFFSFIPRFARVKFLDLIKKIDFFGSSSSADLPTELALTALRVFSGLTLALGHGAHKIPISEKFVQYLIDHSFPFPYFLGWIAGLSEFVGGFLLALGFFTKIAAFFLFITMVVAALYAHRNDPFSEAELAHLYGFVFLLFLAYGGGRFCIDRFFRKKNR